MTPSDGLWWDGREAEVVGTAGGHPAVYRGRVRTIDRVKMTAVLDVWVAAWRLTMPYYAAIDQLLVPLQQAEVCGE